MQVQVAHTLPSQAVEGRAVGQMDDVRVDCDLHHASKHQIALRLLNSLKHSVSSDAGGAKHTTLYPAHGAQWMAHLHPFQEA